LQSLGRVDYQFAYDDEAVEAFKMTAKMEGILPALESSHALAYAYKLAATLGKEKTILVNLS
jgi:tryptophan synthase beta chain